MKKLIISLCAIASTLGLFAQEKTQELNTAPRPNTNKYIFSIVPQAATEHALRIDIERRLNNGTSVIVTPRLYVDNSGFDWNDDNSMIGFGTDVLQKVRISDLTKTARPYIMYGGLYNFYDIIDEQTEWVTDNTLDVPTLQAVDVNKHIYVNKVGANLAIGLELEPIKRFVIDLYTGVGARYSFVSKGEKNFIEGHSSIFDEGYSGITPLFVIKIGVVF